MQALEGLAGVVPAQGQPTVAARLLGAADVIREATGEARVPADRAAYERDADGLQATLGAVDFAAAWAGGRTMSPERAVAYALADAPEDAPAVPQPATPPRSGAGHPKPPAGLTLREAKVLRLLAGGRSNREIAGALGLSVRTAERHVANVYAKIGAHGRAAAAAYAVSRELI